MECDNPAEHLCNICTVAATSPSVVVTLIWGAASSSRTSGIPATSGISWASAGWASSAPVPTVTWPTAVRSVRARTAASWWITSSAWAPVGWASTGISPIIRAARAPGAASACSAWLGRRRHSRTSPSQASLGRVRR